MTADQAAWDVPLVLGLSVQHHVWCAAKLVCRWVLEEVPLETTFMELADAEFDL